MNIIFCRYRNVCEPDYIDAFEMLGINVIELFVNELGVDTVQHKQMALEKVIMKTSPIFVFSVNFFPYMSIVCQSLNVKYVSVSVTCPVVEIYNTTIRNSCNRVFLFDRQQYKSIRDENPEYIFYLPLGAAVSRLKEAVSPRQDYLYDVSFVGSLYNEKDPFLKADFSDEKKHYYENILNEQITLTASGQAYVEECVGDADVEYIKKSADDFYPSDMSVSNIDRFVAISNYLSPHMTYLERVRILNLLGEASYRFETHLFTKSDTSALKGVVCHGGVATLSEMPKVFAGSRINLNITTRSIKTGIPQRVWDVLACGGFLLTNYQEELPEYFENKKHLVMYENIAQMQEIITYYLEHEDIREEIADTGQKLVEQKGKVLDRVVEIIKSIA